MELERLRRVALDARVPTARDAKRIQSLRNKHCSGWLLATAEPEQDEDDSLWLPAATFRAQVLFRLGIPILDTSQGGIGCTLCGKVLLDQWGDHTLCCNAGGSKIRLSHIVQGTVETLLRLGGYSVSRENHCFAADPGKRMDLVATRNDGHRLAIDVAVTHASLGDPNGYARNVKHRKYDALAQLEPNLTFLPVVFDTVGNVNDAARDMLRRVATAWGQA